MVLAPISKGHLYTILKKLKFRQKVYLGQDDDEDATITKRKGKREREYNIVPSYAPYCPE